MSKKNTKHRSKASQKRHAATKRSNASKLRKKQRRKLEQRYPRLKRQSVFSIDDIDEAPTVLEIAHSYDADDLGTKDMPGMLSVSLAQYIGAVRDRLANGEMPKRNAFIQFGYSHYSVQRFKKEPRMHANGGANMPLVEMALLGSGQGQEFIMDVEAKIREIVAQFNERNDDIIRSVHMTIDETDDEVEPSTAFGFEGGDAAIDYRIEKEVGV